MIQIKADISAKLWCNSLAHAYKKIHSISQRRPHSSAIKFTLLLTNEPSLPYHSRIRFSQSPAHLPLTNQTYPDFRPDQPQLIPESHTVDFTLLPASVNMGCGGGLAVLDQCSYRPSSLMEMGVQFMWNKKHSRKI